MTVSSRLVLAVLGALAVSACARGARPTASRTATLAVLPSESDQFPRLVAAVNERLREAPVAGVAKKITPEVSLEVVQLSIECVDSSAECYRAVGKWLSADRLLFARIDRPSGASYRTGDEHHQPVKVTVTIFDLGVGATLGVADRTFPDEDTALARVSEVVEQAVRAAAEVTAR